MPEIAAMWTVGFVICWLANTVILIRHRRRYQMADYLCLQNNLVKAGMYWSDHQGQIFDLKQTISESYNPIAEDQADATQSLLYICGGASAFAWLGLIFVLILERSLRHWARPRFEIRIMVSSLANNSNLDAPAVLNILRQLLQDARAVGEVFTVPGAVQ